MKLLKRYLLFIAFIISLFFISNIKTTAVGGVSETGGAGYSVTERIVSNQFDYGIKQHTDVGITFRDNSVYPQQVNAFEIPASSGVKIISYANFDNNVWNATTVRNFAKKYEKENPGWRVIGGINGDFFDINSTKAFPKQTSGALVSDGENFKTKSGLAVGFTNDGSANPLIIGTPKRAAELELSVYDENDLIVQKFTIQKLNVLPGPDETAIYFGNYKKDVGYVSVTIPDEGYNSCFYVENAEYALPNDIDDFYGRGVISKTTAGTLKKGEFAIITNNEEIGSCLASGMKIRVQYVFEGAFANASSISGQNGQFLKNGEYNNVGIAARHPRTMLGIRADGTIIMAVVDGRQDDDGMAGTFENEMAAIMKSYNCVNAYNFDGGGSSTLIIRENDDFKVMNSPSDGFERSDANCVLIVTRDPEINYSIDNVTEDSLTVSASLIAAYSHHIEQVTVRVNGVTKPVENGFVTFTGLSSNKEYRVDFYYRTPSGINYKIANIADEIKTPKRHPVILGFYLNEGASEYAFSVIYTDIDKSSDLSEAELIINGVTYHMESGALTLNRGEIGPIKSLIFQYCVYLGEDNTVVVTFVNTIFPSTAACDKLYCIADDFIKGIYTG